MALAILASLMMSVSTACASGDVGNLPAQQTGHDLDAGQRILHLVRDGGRHLADGREPVAKPLTLFELLDARQVLEEHRRADHLARRRRGRARACSRSPCPTAAAASPRGWAAWCSSNAPISTRTHLGVIAQHFGDSGCPRSSALRLTPKIRYASSLINADACRRA